MMCDLVLCHGERTTCMQFPRGRAYLCFSNGRVRVLKIFNSQSVHVAQTPCKQYPFNQKSLMSMDFTLDLFIRAFFGRGDSEVRHSELCQFCCRMVLENPNFISGYHSL